RRRFELRSRHVEGADRQARPLPRPEAAQEASQASVRIAADSGSDRPVIVRDHAHMDRHTAKTNAAPLTPGINTEAATPPRRKTASSLHPHALAYGVDEAARLVGVSRRTL